MECSPLSQANFAATRKLSTLPRTNHRSHQDLIGTRSTRLSVNAECLHRWAAVTFLPASDRLPLTLKFARHGTSLVRLLHHCATHVIVAVFMGQNWVTLGFRLCRSVSSFRSLLWQCADHCQGSPLTQEICWGGRWNARIIR